MAILGYVKLDQTLITFVSGVSRTSLRRILKSHKMNSSMIKLTQELNKYDQESLAILVNNRSVRNPHFVYNMFLNVLLFKIASTYSMSTKIKFMDWKENVSGCIPFFNMNVVEQYRLIPII